jgi:hypothetical protein
MVQTRIPRAQVLSLAASLSISRSNHRTFDLAKKEAKRLEKEAKLAAKTTKVSAATAAGEKKVKVEKEKKDEEGAFVNITPPGQKKGHFISYAPACTPLDIYYIYCRPVSTNG